MAMAGSSASGEPQSSPKRLREGGDTDPEPPLTYSLLQQALHQNQVEITNSFQESLQGFNFRVAAVEPSIEAHVNQTTRLLQAMTDRHCATEKSVATVSQTNEGILQRLELLEGKFATASFATGSSTRTSDGTGENGRPAIIVGGYDADQSAAKTLRLAKHNLTELRIDLDLEPMFVPGLRRGFAILPVEPRNGEEQQQFRTRIREALRTVRAAKIVAGQKPQGGDRYFFAAMSESPARRRRAQFAGKVKRLVLEADGDLRKLEVEFGTGNLWYDSQKIASGVTSAPEGCDEAGPGWINIPLLAQQLGGSESDLRTRWGELKATLPQ